MKRLYKLFILIVIIAGIGLNACKKTDGDTVLSEKTVHPNGKITTAIPTQVLYGPTAESKCYKLFSGYINSGLNSLSSGSNSSSGYEGITYDSYNTPNFYVVTESAQHNGAYYPIISQYDASLNLQSTAWAPFSFSSSNSNKAFEGVAWVRRNNDDYLLGLVEGTGDIVVMQQSGSSWTYVTTFTIPAVFTDYSDIALYGSQIAVTSQEDSRVWVGTLSSASWSVTGTGTIYTFPTGSSSGVVGSGSYVLYGNVEGVSFMNDSTIVTCTDKVKSSQPSYQSYKDQSVQIFTLR